MEALTEFGFVGIVAFGSVAILSYFLRDNDRFDFGSREKAVALIVFAFIYGFVPEEFGNAIAERIKDAIIIGTSLTAVYVTLKNVAGKIGGN
ncbi:hypothetical protein LCGC14_2811220 [marine sediment metagenome]|uniref:Uncharacterized protein n=1 Tax=marine sediment metagenome TaxID=412755 RepID=A0A0F8Z6L0_9ZZZZ